MNGVKGARPLTVAKAKAAKTKAPKSTPVAAKKKTPKKAKDTAKKNGNSVYP